MPQTDDSHLKPTLISEIEHIDSDSCELTSYYVWNPDGKQTFERVKSIEKRIRSNGRETSCKIFAIYEDSTICKYDEETTIDTIDTKIIRNTTRYNRDKQEVITDTRGNVESNTLWTYDTQLQTWRPFSKGVFQYDEKGNETLCLSYEHCDSSWCLVEKRVEAYNEEG